MFTVKKLVFVTLVGSLILIGMAIPLRTVPVGKFTGFKNKPGERSDYHAFGLVKKNIHLRFEGVDLNVVPVYCEVNRYYVPFEQSANQIRRISLAKWGVRRPSNTLLGEISDTNLQPGERVKVIGGQTYISLYDLVKTLNLKTDWDIEGNTISLYLNREKPIIPRAGVPGTPALIRLEDITANANYSRPEALAKLRAIADYLYSQGVPFHIAWVPRYLKPQAGIDNDLTRDLNMSNADFLFTLDYMVDRKGLVGLHGYTHQYGNSESLMGTEFHSRLGDGIPGSVKYAADRINRATEAAAALGIPYWFFEAPHYSILPNQLKVVEKDFNIVYQRYPRQKGWKIVTRFRGQRKIKYIPTPLGYVTAKGGAQTLLSKLAALQNGELASFFFHPYLEFKDIELRKDMDGYPYYTYSKNSVLHQLIQGFTDRGYQFVDVKDIK